MGSLAKRDTCGYYHCEGDNCDFMAKRISKLVYFKGRYLCFRCKLKASKVLTTVPPLIPTENQLRLYTRIPEARNLPKEKYRDYLRVTPELRAWAERKHRERKQEASPVIWVGLSKQEREVLWKHFYKKGWSDEQIKLEIDKVSNQIRKAHQEFKDNLRLTLPSFQEEFRKLTEVRA